jgi:ubiquinol-cytochrome c reductase cytochrome c1 subunit
LHGFYVDKTRPWGVNNLYLSGTAMPPVLSGLQGLQKPVYKNEKDPHGSAKMVLTDAEAMTPGSMKPEEYDQFVRDIVNFLDYAAEPIKSTRESMGIFVMLFLLVFFVFAYFQHRVTHGVTAHAWSWPRKALPLNWSMWIRITCPRT